MSRLYLIFGELSAKSTVQGTASFIKLKGKTFLMTAAHVLDGSDFKNLNSDEKYPDTLYIRLYRSDNGLPEFLELPITNFKGQKGNKPYYEKADFQILEVTIPSIFKLNTIETYINCPNTLSNKKSDVVLFGFPVTDTAVSFLPYIEQITPKKVMGKIKGNYSDAIKVDKIDRLDSLNYIASYKDHRLGPGHSGSPVFFIYRSKNNLISNICFGGVACMRDEKTKIMVIVRPEYIKKLFSNL